MARVSETPRSSSRGFPAGATEVWPDERSPDDWLGERVDCPECGGDIVERRGGKVEAFAFVVELSFLHGRQKLGHPDIHSIVRY